MPGPLLLLLYLGVALAPVGLAWAAGLPPRPFWDEVSSALAMIAFSTMLAEFLLSGRFHAISGRIGIDRTMRFHQLFARTVLLLVVIHPFIYTLPIPAAPPPWDPTSATYLRLDGGGLLTGAVAWLLLITLILTSMARDALPYSYETWRLGHGVGAAVIAGLTALHAFDAGRYSGTGPLFVFWLVLLGIAVATLVHVYLISPLLALRTPFKVTGIGPIAERTWELSIARRNGKPFSFQAGQFVWISLRKGPFTLHENPFSIASAPAKGETVSFVIKEVGDFTRSLDKVSIGDPAWVDGPHGGLHLPDSSVPGVGLIGGGAGVAPLLSVLRQMRATGDTRPVSLLYGNRVESLIVYREELDTLADEPGVSITHVLGEPPEGWDGMTGVIDAASIAAAFPKSEGTGKWAYLLCGPPGMIDSAEATLTAQGVPAGQIRGERFIYD